MTATAPGTSRARWLAPAALIVLALVPVAAGAARLVELSGGAVALPEQPRSAAAPVPLVVHILSALVFTVVGAFQFVPGTRGRRPRWHRLTGRIAAPAGLVAALSGLWLTVVIIGTDSGLLSLFRAAAGIGMAGSLVLGVAAVLRRDLARHRAWMLRGYALGLGAGTQVITAGVWLAVVGGTGSATEAWPMGAGWLINLAVAEWLIRRRAVVRARRSPSAPAATVGV
ncbi:DUF2306 domain-containing protein [Blastococcus sp. LR1]|uniref:DUF2306 domain-containing protein n=1 Tax=Blastococcus sp. LR1 TaxID=2877000 RepID=UPI001CCDAF9E|nr:DUF2306 domain-containing protein [Blastococcus sp. LR1]MCA0143953.1 DUF2306 domain-containing protein [Blastococcus sp. LR1]